MTTAKRALYIKSNFTSFKIIENNTKTRKLPTQYKGNNSLHDIETFDENWILYDNSKKGNCFCIDNHAEYLYKKTYIVESS